MSLNTVCLRPMRRADIDALVDLLRRTWYADGEPQVQTMVARADLEFCLARTTTAIVTEYRGVRWAWRSGISTERLAGVFL